MYNNYFNWTFDSYTEMIKDYFAVKLILAVCVCSRGEGGGGKLVIVIQKSLNIEREERKKEEEGRRKKRGGREGGLAEAISDLSEAFASRDLAQPLSAGSLFHLLMVSHCKYDKDSQTTIPWVLCSLPTLKSCSACC